MTQTNLLAAVFTLEDAKQIRTRINAGSITAAELREEYARAVASEASILAELSSKTIKELAPRGAGGLKKSQLIKQVHHSILQNFIVGTFSWSPFSETITAAVERVIQSQTDEQIQKHAQEYAERVAEIKQRFSDPQTLEQFESFIRVRGRDALTAEQLARYDDLAAENRRKRDELAKPARVAEAVATSADMAIREVFHERRQTNVFVVQLSKRVERDEYMRLLDRAKRLGGWYSSFKKDSAGFHFETRENATQFMQVGEAVELQKQDTSEQRAESLAEKAERIEERAEAVLSVDRKTNTVRRADMAASAEMGARTQLRLAENLRRISEALASEQLTHLRRVQNIAQVETLQSILRAATYRRMHAEGIRGDERPPSSMADVPFVQWPAIHVHRSNLREIIAKASTLDGCKLDASRLEKSANKNTDEVLAFSAQGSYEFTSVDNLPINVLERLCKRLQSSGGLLRWTVEGVLSQYATVKRLHALDIRTLPELRAALREFLTVATAEAPKPDPIKEMERALIGVNLPGFFPTPGELADRVMELADIREGMRVLEPEAGKGDLAEPAREAGGLVECCEMQGRLRSILEARGFSVIGWDFMDLEPQPIYDRIVMNPPFENGQDIEHTRRAYEWLKPGGRLVSIMSEGSFYRSDRKAEEFRAWLDEVGGESETNPEGAFKSAFRSTGVNTRTVTIDKGGAQ